MIICMHIVSFARKGMPIASRPGSFPIYALHFMSHASGSNFAMKNGSRINLNTVNDRGVCSLGMDGNTVKTCCIIKWPLRFLNDATDSKGAHFGSKTTTLEMVGLLLPLLTVPHLLVGKHAVFSVDNIAFWHGWKSRGISNDITASILIRAMYLISYFVLS